MTVHKKKRSARVERILKKKEPQLVENTKKALIMRGNRTSEDGGKALKDIAKLLKPNAKTFSRKNDIHPFDDANSIEFLCERNDCSLFVIASHSKKRPHNLIMGRMYDGHLLDMVEMGMTDFHSIESFVSRSKGVGSKPAMIFLGDGWESDTETLGRVQNLLIDVFRGDKIDKLSLKGMDHVMAFSIVNGTIMMRLYYLRFKKSGTKVPLATLEPMGPFMNLTIRRVHLASEDMWKTACKAPKGVSAAKKKNIKHTEIGEKMGRVHLKKQQLENMGGRRVNALRTKS